MLQFLLGVALSFYFRREAFKTDSGVQLWWLVFSIVPFFIIYIILGVIADTLFGISNEVFRGYTSNAVWGHMIHIFFRFVIEHAMSDRPVDLPKNSFTLATGVCPHCKSKISRFATVCPRCTTSLKG